MTSEHRLDLPRFLSFPYYRGREPIANDGHELASPFIASLEVVFAKQYITLDVNHPVPKKVTQRNKPRGARRILHT